MKTWAAERILIWTIELNLLLWIAMAGVTFSGNVGGARYVAIAGAVFSAAIQHWAYYHVRRRRQQQLPRGLCERCGYDMRGTPERCPECGTVPAKTLQ